MMTPSTMLMSVMLMMVMVSLHGSTCKHKYYRNNKHDTLL